MSRFIKRSLQNPSLEPLNNHNNRIFKIQQAFEFVELNSQDPRRAHSFSQQIFDELKLRGRFSNLARPTNNYNWSELLIQTAADLRNQMATVRR